jgi:hypothetical protein
MARRLRFSGTGSGVTGCPSVHEDLDSGEVIVHGPPLTESEDVAQLQHLSEGEVAVVVPRDLLVDWSPKERTRQVRTIDLDEFHTLFEKFEHTAWRLETRGRFWLFDSRLIALLRFDEDDQLTHVDLITEPAEVVRCSMIRDAAWHHAVPWRDFLVEM